MIYFCAYSYAIASRARLYHSLARARSKRQTFWMWKLGWGKSQVFDDKASLALIFLLENERNRREKGRKRRRKRRRKRKRIRRGGRVKMAAFERRQSDCSGKWLFVFFSSHAKTEIILSFLSFFPVLCHFCHLSFWVCVILDTGGSRRRLSVMRWLNYPKSNWQ